MDKCEEGKDQPKKSKFTFRGVKFLFMSPNFVKNQKTKQKKCKLNFEYKGAQQHEKLGQN